MLPAPKKRLGQHFLRDGALAGRIAGALSGEGYEAVLEIGPGRGILTRHLLPRWGAGFYAVELDDDLFPALRAEFPALGSHLFAGDFLALDMRLLPSPMALAGNFPYNISSQILFKLVEHRDRLPELVGMFQKEVAERVIAPPGGKVYGLLSAWVQTFYEGEYLFTVEPGAFNPPPQVHSGVIRLRRRPADARPDFEPKLLLSVIKAAFATRRKTLRNCLRTWEQFYPLLDPKLLDARAETLGPGEFVELARVFGGGA